jgi:hypothetical protein
LGKLAVFWTKTPMFGKTFWRKYFQNHNIGPWMAAERTRDRLAFHLFSFTLPPSQRFPP